MIELFLNLAYAAGTMIAPSIALLSNETVALPSELNKVVQVSFYRHWTASDSDCKYYGVAVSFDRTWDEVNHNDGTETRRPAEPGKIAGYGILLNKKICEDGEHPLAYVAEKRPGLFSNRLQQGIRVDADNLVGLPESKRPEWLDKAIKTAVDQGAIAFDSPEVLTAGGARP